MSKLLWLYVISSVAILRCVILFLIGFYIDTSLRHYRTYRTLFWILMVNLLITHHSNTVHMHNPTHTYTLVYIHPPLNISTQVGAMMVINVDNFLIFNSAYSYLFGDWYGSEYFGEREKETGGYGARGRMRFFVQ